MLWYSIKYIYYGCNSLKSIIIPENSSISFDNDAFDRYYGIVYNLSNAPISNYSHVFTERAEEGDYVFGKKDGQWYFTEYIGEETDLVLPDDVNDENYELYSIHEWSKDLTSIDFGNSVTNIPDNYFQDNKTLIRVNITNVLSIGSSAFNGCTGLSELTLENVETIGESAFNGCTGLTELTLEKNLKSIGLGAFDGCYNLQTLNYNVVHFENKNGNLNSTQYPLEIKSISTLNLGKDVELIPGDAFNGNKKLTTVVLAEGNKLQSIGNSAFSGCSGLISINLNSNIKTIGNSAFYGCSSIEAVDLSGIQTIGNLAFYGCSSIETVDLSSVQNIGDYAFLECSKITSVDLENIQSLGKFAFYGCSGLIEVTIGKDLPSAGIGVFAGCNNIQTLNYNAANFANVYNSSSNAYYNGNWYNYPFEFKSISTLYLGKDVELIPDNAFGGNENLSTVVLAEGNKLQSIDNSAFRGCSGLKSINLNGNIKTIGNSAFYGCSSIEAVDLSGIQTIGNLAFYGCSSIETVNLSSVQNIDDYAFYDCNSITSFTFGNALETIGQQAFNGCNNITSLTFGNSVSNIADNSFSFNAPLEKVTVGNNYGLKHILGKQYYDKTNWRYTGFIKNLVIAEDFTDETISGSFKNQYQLETIDCKTAEPLAFSEAEPFTESQYENIMVTVPEESADKYKAARIWELFYVTSGDCVVKLYNGNSEKLMIVQKGTEKPAEATAMNAILLIDEQLEDGDELLGLGNVVYRDAQGQWVAKKIELVDGEPLYCPVDVKVGELTYTRNFKNTNYQALYVPFSMQYSDWSGDFKVYRLNAFYQRDTDDDGLFNDWWFNIAVVKGANGSLKPNHPYVISAIEAGEKTITLSDRTLYQTVVNSVDCSSVETLNTFRGTYQKMQGMKSAGYYVFSKGELCPVASDEVTLGAFRWYLNMTGRNGQFISGPAKIRFATGDEATGIDDCAAEEGEDGIIYNLRGQAVSPESLQRGVYIRNGKKFIIK